MNVGSPASGSIFWRMRLTCTSTLRSTGPATPPCVRSSNCSRDSTSPAWVQKASSRSNSALVVVTSAPCGLMSLRSAGAGGALVGAGAAQQGAYAGDEFAGVERLRYVIVGADLQPDDTVDIVAERRHHDDRQIGRGGAQPHADRPPVLAGEHQVEQQQVDLFAAHRPVHLRPGGGDADAEAVLAQGVGQHVLNGGVIFDEQDAGLRLARRVAVAGPI